MTASAGRVQTRRSTAVQLLERLGPARRRLSSAVRAVDTFDVALYRAVANTPSPALDRRLTQLSNAANYSRLWLGIAAGLVAFGNRRMQRAAALGVVSIGLTS